MASAPFEIIAGPAYVYWAPVGTAFPGIAADPTVASPVPWTYLGLTSGGITVTHTQTIVKVMSDQYVQPIKAFRSEELLEIDLSILQLTLENYAFLLNNIPVQYDGLTPHSKFFELARQTTVNLVSLLVRGPSPYGNWNLQYEVPIVFADDNPVMSFDRTKESVLKCKFSALGNLLAEDNSEVYGVLRAEDS